MLFLIVTDVLHPPTHDDGLNEFRNLMMSRTFLLSSRSQRGRFLHQHSKLIINFNFLAFLFTMIGFSSFSFKKKKMLEL